jgi:hypothetical protein
MDDVYRERDQLVAFLTRIYPSFLAPAPDAEPGFNWIVYVDTPEGQLSWHVADHEIDEFFKHLNKRMTNPWDGHTTEEKYRRLVALRPPMLFFDGVPV